MESKFKVLALITNMSISKYRWNFFSKYCLPHFMC